MGRARYGRMQDASSNEARGYMAFYPCFQANTDTSLEDRSTQNNDGSFNSLAAGTAWAVANRLSQPTTASQKVTIAKSVLSNWRWNENRKDSLLIHFRGKVTPAAANFLGNANSASEGGFKFTTTAGGNWQIAFYDKVNGTSLFGTSTLVDASWNANDHSITLHIDGPNNSYTRYVDGAVFDGPFTMATVPILEPQSSTFDLVIGGSQLAAAGAAIAIYGFHLLYAPEDYGSCVDPNKLALRLHRNPLVAVQRDEWPY